MEEEEEQHKIFVSGLPWAAIESEVWEFFQGCGTVKTCEIPCTDSGRSSGTAFVTFSERSELDAAIALNGELWPGSERWLKIVEGAEKFDRKSFGGAYYTTL